MTTATTTTGREVLCALAAIVDRHPDLDCPDDELGELLDEIGTVLRQGRAAVRRARRPEETSGTQKPADAVSVANPCEPVSNASRPEPAVPRLRTVAVTRPPWTPAVGWRSTYEAPPGRHRKPDPVAPNATTPIPAVVTPSPTTEQTGQTMTTTPQQPGQMPTGWPPPGAAPTAHAYSPPAPEGHRFGGLAWSALILGIVGIVGSPIIIFNNLTAVLAGVGVILGAIALFGSRKLLAGAGVALSVLAIVFTVIAQGAAVEELDRELGEITGEAPQVPGEPAAPAPAAAEDVKVTGCEIVDDGYGYTSSQATVAITNSTDRTMSYWVTVSLNDESGARVGEINAVSNSLAAGQSVTLSGMDASGLANEGATPGPAACTLASVDRFPG